MKKIQFLFAVLFLVLLASPSRGDFLQPFLIKYGPFVAGDEVLLARFDLIAVQRFRYNSIQNDTWGAIKAINPNTEIFNYQSGRSTRDDHDDNILPYYGSISRWQTSRGHSMGSIADNYDEFVLLDASDNYIINPSYPHSIVLNIGSANLRDYWIEASVTDIVGHPWENDGLFADVMTVKRTSMSAMPVLYPTDAAWSADMNSFINAITVGMGQENQKIWCNRTRVGEDFVYNEWIALDSTANPPYAVFDEGVFAVEWGRGSNIIKWTSYDKWKRQVDIMSQIHNSKVTLLSHIPVADGTSGTDNRGKPVDTWDILWYAMASFHLGKNTIDNNSYFSIRSEETYNILYWYDEFDNIDLGNAVGAYQTTNYGGNTIYRREFEDGYVYVNPTNNDVSNIDLPETCKQLNHNNFKNNPDTIPDTNTIDLNSHRGTMLLKSQVNTAPIVDAGTDQTITLPAGATLDGTVTDDGLPDPPAIVITTWSKQSGPGTVTFIDENAVDTTADFSAAGTYLLRLTADDSDLQASDDITITVFGDTIPPAKPEGLDIIE